MKKTDSLRIGARCGPLLAMLLVLAMLAASPGCAPKDEMIRLEDEMDRLNGDVDQLKKANRANQEGLRRANAMLEERVNSLQREQAANRAGTGTMSGRLEDLEVWIRRDEEDDVLALDIARIEYAPELDPDLFTVAVPDDVIWHVEPAVLPDNEGYARLAPDEAARAFFEALAAEGTYGELASTYPPLTGPAWSSFMTGRSPGNHGIFEFFRRKEGGYGQILNGPSSIDGRTCVLGRLRSGCKRDSFFN